MNAEHEAARKAHREGGHPENADDCPTCETRVIVVEEPYCNHDPVAVVNGVCECGATIDYASSSSRQHYIDTGRFLAEGEAITE